MTDGPVLLLMRAVHVVCGVLWVGAAVFLGFYIIPSVRDAGPGAGPFMQKLGARRPPAYMLTLAVLTVLSGFGLYWRASNGFQSHEWLRSTSAMVFGLGGILALFILILGATVISPAGKRMGELASQLQTAGGPPSPELLTEMERLQARLARSNTIAAVALIVTTLCMAVARYV
jgi:uncharacterized membrane protein